MMKKKIFCFFTLLIILFLSCSNVLAATTSKIASNKTTFELVEKPICEMDLNGMGHFKKELTNFDPEKRELTITLTVSNTADEEQSTKPVEIFLVLDNSNSMTYNPEGGTQGKKKMEYVTETANKFVDSLFTHFGNPKIGVVSFSSKDPVINGTVDKTVLGTADDAVLLQELSNSQEAVKSAITTYSSQTGPYTNIEAGLNLAQANFTDNTETEKYIILLSDGVPNLSIDSNKDHVITYSGTNAANTKKKLEALEASGYHIYSVLMEYYKVEVPNPQAPLVESGERKMTYGELAREVFGTTTNPTVGKFYYIDYENLDDTINQDIYQDITYKKDNSLKNIVIKDYIPQEIMNNFDFMYTVEPTIGKLASDTVDTTDNSITWTIPVLNEGEVATLSYKLKLKDSVDTKILNKVLPTNTKVDIDFETPSGEKKTVTSNVSPKVKLTYEEAKKPDNTVSPNPLPQTGNYITLFTSIMVIGIIVFAFTRITNLKKLK